MCFHIIYWVFTDAISIFSEEDEAIKEKRYVRLAQTVPSKLAKLNEIIVKNNGHLAAGKVLNIIAPNPCNTTVNNNSDPQGGQLPNVVPENFKQPTSGYNKPQALLSKKRQSESDVFQFLIFNICRFQERTNIIVDEFFSRANLA